MPSLPHRLPRLLLPLLVVAAPLAVAAPASADVTGSTATDDVVLYSHCQTHEISYDVLVSPGTLLWRLELQVFDPEGVASEGTVVNSATDPTATHGTVPFTFCGSEEAGTYTVRATGFYELVPAVQLPFALPQASFEVRPTKVRSSVSRTALGHGRYRVDARVREETPKGYGAARGVTVRLERLVHGTWRRIPRTGLTTVRGRASATVDGAPGSKVRAVVPAANNHGGSTSQAITL